MSDLNVDDFHRDLARILSTLYRCFPRPTAIYVEDIVGPDPVDEYGLHSSRHLGCFSTLLWLGEEQMVRHEGPIRREALDQVVLSGSAFTLLSMRARRHEPHDVTDLPPSLREEQSTNIHRLREALSSRSSARLRKVVLDLLAERYRLEGR